jgi:glycerol-3-phosphate dehydrogenase (NAD(P)+)
MPVAQAVAAIVAGTAGVDDVVAGLLARPLRGETD